MMKKTFLAAALLLTSMMAQAQAFMKITPTLKVGDVKTYVTENKKVQQSGTQTTNYETSFKVLKEMEEGFLIEVMQTKLDDKEASSAMERLAQLNSELLSKQNSVLPSTTSTKRIPNWQKKLQRTPCSKKFQKPSKWTRFLKTIHSQAMSCASMERPS